MQTDEEIYQTASKNDELDIQIHMKEKEQKKEPNSIKVETDVDQMVN